MRHSFFCRRGKINHGGTETQSYTEASVVLRVSVPPW